MRGDKKHYFRNSEGIYAYCKHFNVIFVRLRILKKMKIIKICVGGSHKNLNFQPLFKNPRKNPKSGTIIQRRFPENVSNNWDTLWAINLLSGIYPLKLAYAIWRVSKNRRKGIKEFRGDFYSANFELIFIY